MCGRTCCTLSKGAVPLVCSSVLPEGQIPQWRDAPCGGEYHPSANVPPTSYTPILLREGKTGTKDESEMFLVQPMMWGLIPFWHKSENPKDHGLTTNNARLEGLSKSKLYKHSLTHNQRCVVICDGFYEWKTFKDGTKQPYLVYAKQRSDEIADTLGSLDKVKVDSEEWDGPKPLFMAGLYSVWYNSEDPDHAKPVFNYTVITRDSNSTLSWLHDRMPAILPDSESVQNWLDPTIEGMAALKILQPIEKDEISWHPVSPSVGSVRNQDRDLAKRVELTKGGKAMKREANLMSNWLKKSKEKQFSPKKPKKD